MANCATRASHAGGPRSTRLKLTALVLLYLDFDVDAGGKLDALQAVDRLGRVLDDVEQALVHPHLEMLPAVLVLVGRTYDRIAVLLGGEGNRAPDLGLGAQDGLHDLLGGLVDDLVVVGLQADPDPLPVAVSHFEKPPEKKCGLSRNASLARLA